jgi:hypothetical protein
LRWSEAVGSADSLSTCFGSLLASPYAGNDKLTFELSHSADDYEKESACGGCSVNALRVGLELDTERLKFFKRSNQMGNRAGETVKSPYQNLVRLATATVGHQLVKCWPFVFGTADTDINVLGDLSRFARNLQDQLQVTEELGKHGVNLRSVYEPYVDSSTIGRYLSGQAGLNNQLFSDQLSDRQAGMVLKILFSCPFHCHVAIELRGIDFAMPQDRLHGAKIRTAV